MVKWDAKYETGIEAVDDQHRELFKLVGELSHAIGHHDELDCSFVMARLEVYSLYHFTSEEHLMMKYGYPELEQHKKEHHKFRVKILSVKEKCLADHSDDSRVELLKYLENWVQSHLIEMDHKYVPYLKKA